MKIRICYNGAEEIYECEDMVEALESFCVDHSETDASDCTVTEVGSFYDRNR